MSNTTLSSKSIGIKLQKTHTLTEDQLKCVVTYLPRDANHLREIVPDINEGNVEKVLAITRAHERNQARFAECVSHLRAFVRGGDYGVHLLNRLHDRILTHFGMQDERWEALTAAGVRVNVETGGLSA